MLKKIVIALGTLFALLIAAAIAVPLMVNVDKYRPQIVQIAQDHMNGKLTLGKLSLSLWGQIRVEIAGLAIADSADHQVLSVKDAFVQIPFSSLLGGSPSLLFRMDRPVLTVAKGKTGQMNLMALIKPSIAEAPAQAKSANSGQTVLPALVTQARLSVEMNQASLAYHDEASGMKTEIQDLNLRLKDLSLTRTTEFEIWANLNTEMNGKAGSLFSLHGPARFEGQAKPELSGAQFDHLSLNAKVNLDALDISVGQLFHKSQTVPAHASLALWLSPKEVRIDQLNLQFFNAEIKSHGTVTGLASLAANPGQTAQQPLVQYSVASNEIEFKPWVELIPLLKEGHLGGAASLTAEVKGSLDHLTYQALMQIKALTAKTPMLKTQPRIDGSIKVMTDQVEDMNLSLSAPGNDLKIRGKVVSFSQPRVSLQVVSSGMDLDQLIEFPAPGAAKATANAATAQGEAPQNVKGQGSEDYDALLNPLRESKIAQAASGNVVLDFKILKAYEVKMTDLSAKMALKDLQLGLDSFSMKLWDGNIKASASIDLKPAHPKYKLNTQVAGLDLAQAVASQFHFLKNTLLGHAGFEMSGQGESFNPSAALSQLNARGKLRVEKATFASVDVGKMVSEALNGAIDRVASQVPPLKGKKVGTLPGGSSKYDLITSDFGIADGKFSAPNFIAKASPNQGIDLKGNTQVVFKDYGLNASWEVVDTYNLTHAKDLAIEQAGTRVEHILAEGNSPVRFPVHAGCTLIAPCYTYTEVPQFLGKVALSNVSQAVTGRAKSEIKKKVESLVPKSAPPVVQDALKKLFGN